MEAQASTAPDWSLDEIPLAAVDPARVRAREDLFYLVTAASFVESGADLYSQILADQLQGDDEVVDWLNRHWRVEETRHGRALRAYGRHVWPEFDWDRAYAGFLRDYGRQCTTQALEPTPCLEMAARCVVETGTATFYQALAEQAGEPVLAGIASRIRADEIGHYKHFYRYFRAYGQRQPPGRLRVLAALGRRLLEARRGDGECALWHVYRVRQPTPDKAAFGRLSKRLGARVADHYPARMAARMLLKPLDLPGDWPRALEKPLGRAITWVLR